MLLMYGLLLICIPTIIWYVYFKKCFTYWGRKNIPSRKPVFPTGNVTSAVLGKSSMFTIIEEIYREFKSKGHKHAGLYFFNGPVYLPIDLEIIKSIMVSDFECFSDRGGHYDEGNYPLSGHLFSLRGTEWKNLRRQISPIFSTGRIKSAVDIFINQTFKMVERMEIESAKGDVNMKKLTMNLTTDIMAMAGFSFDAGTVENPDNDLAKHLSKVFKSNLSTYLKMLLLDGFKSPANLMRLVHDNKDVERFFQRLVTKLIEMRSGNSSSNDDFFNHLLELKEKKGLSFNKILSNSYLFFFASYETASQSISFCIHELTYNRDVQDKLREEIRENLDKDPTKWTYENIDKLSYLSNVFKETVRLYPVMGILIRMCSKPYKIPGTDTILDPGTPVVISTLGLQRDPQYFQNPLKFYPERFDEYGSAIPPAYIPFGDGPRICIGMRFAAVWVKTVIAVLVSQFKFVPSPRGRRDLEIDPWSRSPAMTMKTDVVVNVIKI